MYRWKCDQEHQSSNISTVTNGSDIKETGLQGAIFSESIPTTSHRAKGNVISNTTFLKEKKYVLWQHQIKAQLIFSPFKFLPVSYCSPLNIPEEHVTKKMKHATPQNLPIMSDEMKGKAVEGSSFSEPIPNTYHHSKGNVPSKSS